MTALLLQGMAALLVVAALAYARRCLRTRVGGRPELEVMERRMLGRDSGVAVVRWCGQQVLVGFSASGITPLYPLSGFDAISWAQAPSAEEQP